MDSSIPLVVAEVMDNILCSVGEFTFDQPKVSLLHPMAAETLGEPTGCLRRTSDGYHPCDGGVETTDNSQIDIPRLVVSMTDVVAGERQETRFSLGDSHRRKARWFINHQQVIIFMKNREGHRVRPGEALKSGERSGRIISEQANYHVQLNTPAHSG
jgi:hypothetical protein